MKRATAIPFILLVVLAFAALFAKGSPTEVPPGERSIRVMSPGC